VSGNLRVVATVSRDRLLHRHPLRCTTDADGFLGDDELTAAQLPYALAFASGPNVTQSASV
jgi:hypothetical protein